MLIYFARSNQPFITNTMFKKEHQRRYTWNIANVFNEIDLLMIKSNQKHLIQNVDVINRFRYDSDHRMVRAKLILKYEKKEFNQMFYNNNYSKG